MTPNSAVPEAIQTLVTLFEAELPDVAFPDVDANTLRQLADEVELGATAVEEAERIANTARRTHADARAALLLAAQRGAGYARVYADDNEALLAKLSQLSLDDKPKQRKATTRRRPRKAPPKPEALRRDASVAELPLAADERKAGAA